MIGSSAASAPILRSVIGLAPFSLCAAAAGLSSKTWTIQSAHGKSNARCLPEGGSHVQMEPLMQAQVHGGLAQTLLALFSMYLKTQGIDPEQHPMAKEQVCLHSVTLQRAD